MGSRFLSSRLTPRKCRCRMRASTLIVSEYGASIWCDPYRWIPEAARLLRPGGDLVFLVNGTLLVLTSPDEDNAPAGIELLRDYFDMHRFEWPDDDDKSV